MKKLIKTDQWAGADYRWRPFNSPTGHYLEIRLPHSCVTISQVQDPAQQPRDVRFRSNKRLSNQKCLDLDDFCKEQMVCGLPHILLIHGHQSLNFAHLGIPHENHKCGYIYKTGNLLLMPHEISAPTDLQVPQENTDLDLVLTLKEEIERWRRNNGD